MGHSEEAGIDQSLAATDSSFFSPEAYAYNGVFVLRGAIPTEVVAGWRAAWDDFYARDLADGREIDPYNPVVVKEALPSTLEQIYRCPAILDVMEKVYPDLALYMQRFVIKDARSRGAVFLHHDFGYDLGWPEKTAVFVPLSPVSSENGGLIMYPRTHKLGYLGDVGEFNKDLVADWPTVCPSVKPGDLILMHECTWHGSMPHSSGPDRILVQITYQLASDPSGVELLRGQWRTDLRYVDLPHQNFFKRGRSSRLRELQAQLDRLTERQGSS